MIGDVIKVTFYNRKDPEHLKQATVYLRESQEVRVYDLGRLQTGEKATVIVGKAKDGGAFWRATEGLEIDRNERSDKSVYQEDNTTNFLVIYNPESKRSVSFLPEESEQENSLGRFARR